VACTGCCQVFQSGAWLLKTTPSLAGRAFEQKAVRQQAIHIEDVGAGERAACVQKD
jgi:hypothetical protein